MAAANPKKPGDRGRARYGKGIPRGDAFLPGVDADILQKLHAEMSGKDVGKEIHILAAAIKWREGLGVSEIVRRLLSAPLHRARLAGAAARPRARGHL